MLRLRLRLVALAELLATAQHFLGKAQHSKSLRLPHVSGTSTGEFLHEICDFENRYIRDSGLESNCIPVCANDQAWNGDSCFWLTTSPALFYK